MNKSMKIFFWLLVAANVIFFAVMKSGVFQGAQPEPAQPVLHPEKIILLNASKIVVEAPQAASAVVASASAVAAPEPSQVKAIATACYEWGEFSSAELERANSALKALQLGDKLSQHEIEHTIGYWVYIPPLKDKVAISQKLAQLKARGVTEYFVVQEAGEWLNAISLGIFKTRDAAQSFLQGLNEKEVRTAQVGERASKTKTTVFLLNSLNAEKISKLNALQKDFPAETLKSVPCH